jgi:hypothetical protein
VGFFLLYCRNSGLKAATVEGDCFNCQGIDDLVL